MYWTFMYTLMHPTKGKELAYWNAESKFLL